MNLEQSRKTIDEIDSQLTKLFAERMDTAAEIARYKKEHGMKVLDSARERAKLNDIASMVPEELSDAYAARILDFTAGTVETLVDGEVFQPVPVRPGTQK